MSRNAVREGEILVLRGDTYTIKEKLKQIGSRWDGGRRVWIMPYSPAAVQNLRELGFDTIPDAATEPVELSGGESALEKTWSVKELVAHMGMVIATHLGGSYWVSGEVSSLKSSNGHFYFELAEPEDQINIQQQSSAAAIACVLWAGKKRMLAEKLGSFEIADGLKVRLLVHIEFRRDSSRLSAIVDDFDLAFTLGDMALNRQNLVRELRKRGLYDRNRSLALPVFPLRVALITAQGSRAFSDFFDELKSSRLAFRVTLFDTHMQGTSTSPDVSWALSDVSRRSQDFDCIVITRGGGSRLDLRWFDDLEICKAIAYSPLPVMTAIGHFEDVSVADEVAFCAEKTPTGAARMLVNTVMENLHNLFLRAEQTAHRALRRLLDERGRLERAEQALASMVLRRVDEERTLQDRCQSDLSTACLRRLAQEKSRIDGLDQTLRLLRSAHERTLDRGFALIRTPQGRALSAAAFEEPNPPTECIVVLRDAKRSRLVEIQTKVEAIKILDQQPPSPQESSS